MQQLVDQIAKERKQHLENIEKLSIHDIREMVSLLKISKSCLEKDQLCAETTNEARTRKGSQV